MKNILIIILGFLSSRGFSQEIRIIDNTLIYNNKKYDIQNVEKACSKTKTTNNKICNFIINNKNQEDRIEDPLIGNIKERNSYDIYTQIGLFGSVKGYSLNVIKQYNHLGFGFFASNLKVNNQSGDYILGYSYGVSMRYNLLNNAALDTQKMVLPGFFINIGQTKFKSSVQGILPSYLYGEAGMDISYRIQTLKSSNVDSFLRISTQEIYHSQSQLLNLGNQISIGLKFGF